MPIIDHFGLLAPFYERFIQPPQDTDWHEILKLTHIFTILDVGGGTGRISQLFSGNGHKIFVLDASIKMLAEARLKNNLHLACGYSECIPFPAISFDRVLMVDAFHHLENQVASGRELWRILKPGGRLVIDEPDISLLPVKLIAVGEKLLLMRSHFWRAEQIARLFEDLPCKVQIIRQNGSVYIIVDRSPESIN